MSKIRKLIEQQGTLLKNPHYLVPTKIAFRKLNQQLTSNEFILIAIYTTTSGASVSPCDNYETFRLTRNSKAIVTIGYFEIERRKINL